MRLYSTTIFLFLLLISAEVISQSHTDFYTKTLDINRTGMYFLGGWALANMATGAYGSLRFEGEQKYFHQMNAAWNLVNAGIATYALWEIAGTSVADMTYDEVMRQQLRTERIFLINAGLDILYMAGGAWMIHYARNNEKRRDMLRGYGQSVILQGGFLFIFDLVKFGIQRNHRLSFPDSMVNLGLSSDGLSLVFSF